MSIVLAILVFVFCSGGSILGDEVVRFDRESVTEEEFSLVCERLHNKVSGRLASEESRLERTKDLDPQVQALMDKQKNQTDPSLYGAFDEVKPKDDQHIDFGRGYFDPVRILASAYALPGSSHYRSKEVLDAIHLAFSYTRKHVYPGCEKPGNWWVWAKQMPDCLCDILALLYDDLYEEDREYLISILNYLLGEGPLSGSDHHTGKAGKDALNFLKVGALTRDVDRIATAWECMENGVSPYLLEADGTPLMDVIKADFLGISLPYIYEGYNTVVEWTQLTSGTSMRLRDETTGRIVSYVMNLGMWNTFLNTEVAWLSFTSYRVFWRPSTVLNIAGQLAAADIKGSEDLRMLVSGEMPEPDGCRFWPNAETLIFRFPGHYCSLVMASEPRHPISWSYKNRFLHIGSKWYYGRDGHLVIARNLMESDPNLTYTTNWRRLTGVTCDDGSILDSDQIEGMGTGYWQPQWALCKNPMAGAAVVNQQDAAAGIQVKSGETQARKSYFFIRDHEMIFTIGSHISGRGETQSIVHTFPVESEAQEILIDRKAVEIHDDEKVSVQTPCWINTGGAGYFFPDQGEVAIISELREADFYDSGNPPPEKQPQVPDQKFISIMFPHGENPIDASYASAYLLNTSEEKSEELKKNLLWARNETGHFLSYDSFTGIVFFEAGEIEGFLADRPCLVAMRESDEEVTVAVYEPSWQDAELNLSLPFKVSGGEIPPEVRLDGEKIIIQIKAGQPVEFQCQTSQ